MPNLYEPAASMRDAHLLHRETSRHREIRVYGNGPLRMLQLGPPGRPGLQTLVDPRDPTRPIQAATASLLVAAAMYEEPTRILCLGLGAGNLALALLEVFTRADVDVIELDEAMPPVASEWFGLTPNPRARIHFGDLRQFLRLAMDRGTRWDVILQDCRAAGGVPAYLWTRKHLANLCSCTVPRGPVALTSVAQGRQRDREWAAAAAVFGDRLVMPSWGDAVDIGFADRMPTTLFGSILSHAQALRRVRVDARQAIQVIEAASGQR